MILEFARPRKSAKSDIVEVGRRWRRWRSYVILFILLSSVASEPGTPGTNSEHKIKKNEKNPKNPKKIRLDVIVSTGETAKFKIWISRSAAPPEQSFLRKSTKWEPNFIQFIMLSSYFSHWVFFVNQNEF